MSEQFTIRETEFFRWAYSLLVVLAKEELKKAHNDDGEWPMRQEWSQLGGTSRSVFLHRAREAAGIPHDEFLQVIRNGQVDVEDLYDDELADIIKDGYVDVDYEGEDNG